MTCFPSEPVTPGDCFYLGFERSLAGNAIRLDDRAPASRASASIPDEPPLRWEVWQGEGWIPADVRTPTPPAA